MNLTILSESHPKRCEVCHQNDVFEPVTGVCKRCSEIEMPQTNNAVVPVFVPVLQLCLLSEPAPQEIKELPTTTVFFFALSLVFPTFFYLVYFLPGLLSPFQQPYFQPFLSIILITIATLSFFGAWLFGLFCFRTAWDLYPHYKEYRIFLFSGLMSFWPIIHLVIIFIEGGVGFFGSSDTEC